MAAEVVSREAESRAVADFLKSVSAAPAALVLAGEAGIGKTTMWLAAVELSQQLGFRVLSTRAAEAESVLAYSSLADLLVSLDDAAFVELPAPQRLAIDRVLLRATSGGPPSDQRAVAAALVSVIQALAVQSPLLLAIDDLQWLDHPSRLVISWAVRRLSGPIGVVVTVRDQPEQVDVGAWLQLRRPDMLRRIRLGALSLGALHVVLHQRLGRSFPRPQMRRIHELSGGNPFYALELARAMEDGATSYAALPSSLAELVRARLSGIPANARRALLATACVPAPTLGLIARATGADAEKTLMVLEEVEKQGIIQIDGHQIGFTHPLLARGVYNAASPTGRRAMHRRLAEIIDEPELRARHLARAAASGDQFTLQSLDEAAEMARLRGAPAAAAELLELAMGLDGDTPHRTIRSAAYHFDAGDPARARTILEKTIGRLGPGAQRAEALGLLALVRAYDDSFAEAATLLQRAIEESTDSPASQVSMLVMQSFALFNAGRAEAAMQRAEEAVSRAADLERPDLLSQALGMRVLLRFLAGAGLDESDLHRALEFDHDHDHSNMPLALRPRVLHALLLLWTDQLDAAADALSVISQRCSDRGEESELMFVAFHLALLRVWRGDFADADLLADDTFERAMELNGDLPKFTAFTIRAMVGAYLGRVDQVRRDTADALEAGERCSSQQLKEWSITSLGFLEVSLGNYEAALQVLAPLLARLEQTPHATEIMHAAFIPDAAEAMIGLGRLDEATRLVDVIEGNGRRLDRAWMLAVGARCRSQLMAARGDLDEASLAADRALRQHQRLTMPFELARTQLLVGQLQRRQRHREVASATMREALNTFEQLGSTLWADRARAELHRASGVRTRTELTASERRVAELAITGITTREMGAALFISPKTVESNLSRIYRKLGIHSRAELGRLMGRPKE